MTELNRKTLLLAVFSFNMGSTLANCLDSIKRHCSGFDVVLADDKSDDPETLKVIEQYRTMFAHVYSPNTPKNKKRHGNLYENIQEMCRYALKKGYRYLFMIQDDMQFVRPLDTNVCRQYSDLFKFYKVLQVDPRFLRHAGTIEIRKDMHAYSFLIGDERRSYADVGIIDLETIRTINWKFLPSERENKIALSEMGYLRVFPFTPIVMHVPFPAKYSKGKKRLRFFPIIRGVYGYKDMTEIQIKRMDTRNIEDIPYYKIYIEPYNLGFSHIYYKLRKDRRIFG